MVSRAAPNRDELRALALEGNASDRAFVDGAIRMRWSRTDDPDERAGLRDIHASLRAASTRSHAALRAEIAAGVLRGAALRRRFDEVAPFDRDHFVEEVLGIAYPPLDERAPAREQLPYIPSGYDEIVHALDVTALGPGDRLVDVGSGMGKVVMLAALLAGARSAGIECDGSLHVLAERASADLGLGEAVRFHLGDACEAAVGEADVVFMYLPFTGASLATVLDRLMEGPRPRFLCTGALDTDRYRDLFPAGATRSWLHVYACR